MKYYNEILDLHDSFSPFYVLGEEKSDNWNDFIPTNQFYDLLSEVLQCVESKERQNRLSIWLHGTYGTGKSHATGVIKKLLFAPLSEIESYIERFNRRNDLKHKLLKFRENKKVFPVVMYGLPSGALSNWDLAIEIEKAVRKTLMKKDPNIMIQTDFEVYINHIESDESNYWDLLISKTPELNEFIDNKTELIQKLKRYDKEILNILRNELHKSQRPITVKDITEWLKDVVNVLRENNIADNLIIYWDEFTSVMDQSNSGMNNLIQSIAKLSPEYGIYLYLISHRTQRQGSNRDDRKHILGRFKDLNFQMSDITTYHLIAGYIKKNDFSTWEILRDDKNRTIETLLDKITHFEDSEVKENVRDLFPIHPFTAFVSSLIARVIGSTERSIFKFLNDSENGFVSFINKQPSEGRVFLTAEYVFDFFLKDFEEEADSFYSSVLSRYSNDSKQLERKNKNYLSLFKGLLLLNIVNRIINVATENNKFVIPDESNLELMFLGSNIYDSIPDFLEYLHEKRIILKDVQNRYVVETSSLDITEINSSKRKLEKNYDKIEKIIDTSFQDRLFSNWKNGHRRKDVTDIILMDAENFEHDIRRRIGKFKTKYSYNIIAFIARDHSALTNIENLIKKSNFDTKNTVFVIFDYFLTSEELSEFIEYRARAEVSQKRHLPEEEVKHLKSAEKIIEMWIDKVKDTGYVNWFVFSKDNELVSEKCRFKDFHNALNETISKKIFYRSFDILYPRLKTVTAWQYQMSVTTADKFLSSNTLDELVRSLSGASTNAIDILKDENGTFITNEKLKIVNGNIEHPINAVINKLNNRIKSGEEFNLADVLSFLFETPFGFYKCHVFMATIGFVLRKYKDKFYNVSTGLGEICSTSIMRDMIEKVFKFHCDNSLNAKRMLNVRLGSENEKKLVNTIQQIFALTSCNSLIDTRIHLHEWMKINLGFPLWLFNYSPDINNEDVLVAFDTIHSKILGLRTESQNLSSSDIKTINEELESVSSKLNEIMMNINKELKQNLFITFFSSLDEIKFEAKEYDSLLNFLTTNLQEDQIFWDEEKLTGLIKNWYINKLEQESVTPKLPGKILDESEEQTLIDETDGDDVEEVKHRIEIYKGDLRKLLTKLIEKRPYIIYDLRKMLEESEE
jgi:hypothetical protein